jgi:hypothetical protein
VEEWDIAHPQEGKKEPKEKSGFIAFSSGRRRKIRVIEDGFSRGVLRHHQDPRGRVEQERTP